MSPNIRGARRETCRRDTPFPTDRVQESIKTNRPSPRTWRLRLILVILDTNRKLTARYIYLNRKGGPIRFLSDTVPLALQRLEHEIMLDKKKGK